MARARTGDAPPPGRTPPEPEPLRRPEEMPTADGLARREAKKAARKLLGAFAHHQRAADDEGSGTALMSMSRAPRQPAMAGGDVSSLRPRQRAGSGIREFIDETVAVSSPRRRREPVPVEVVSEWDERAVDLDALYGLLAHIVVADYRRRQEAL